MSETIVLDAGALISLDRNERATWALLRVAAEVGVTVEVPVGVIGQAWRDGKRQALLARALKRCTEIPLDGETARAAGVLCARTETADVIDATVALTAVGSARKGECAILTSDPDDMRLLISQFEPRPNIVTI